MTWTTKRTAVTHRPLPVACRLCGEDYPDDDALWWHECPEQERERRASLPTLRCYQAVERYVDSLPPDHWRRRLVTWGVRQLGPDVTLLDAVARLGPRWAGRVERRIERRDEG